MNNGEFRYFDVDYNGDYKEFVNLLKKKMSFEKVSKAKEKLKKQLKEVNEMKGLNTDKLQEEINKKKRRIRRIIKKRKRKSK